MTVEAISNLPASGFTNTNKELHEWAGNLVRYAKEIFGAQPINAEVWSYREKDGMMLSCDLSNSDKSLSLPIIIDTVSEYYFPEIKGGVAEADVPDMVEAIHLAGIITQALGAKVKVGLGQNEVNPDVLSKPLVGKQTNGKINLWKSIKKDDSNIIRGC